METTTTSATSTFEQDIDEGLSAPLKNISSKYFYDDLGSVIFQDIMKMPEYYPTPCEFEILSLQGESIIEKLNFDEPFNIIEFGAGDGIKTRQLLKKLIENQVDFTYVPIDISQKAIDELEANMLGYLPGLKIRSLVGNYFSMIEELSEMEQPGLFLFLGSNIGNYQEQEANDLLEQFNNYMKSGDKILTGFDLQKNPATIRNAYDDSQGITKAFNMNLLQRMNRELGANFKKEFFDFYSHYNPVNGEVRSYLVSLKQQEVYISKIDKSYSFRQNELIWTELSKKYTIAEIESLASNNGFELIEHFLDCKHYFTDSLWTK
ncbi:L-histidine N(alpha)-methyltransferase [Dyadobacter frigoris]|uniref:L-histidine N(Alpha)-methyltransferase n=1 Tax=Dyadobacter frigoris TaxID=2576211 RepID=A0A4U6D5V2_9BACT|nr:L-histidine N(alpha)-methyltransferase [Dyadobacter frigoris]TKT92749.1 L-histidine N(alpha)-methyltransferase [Dyadobacter frigoris]GLU51649.1 dimethylhistidine N-methyltransferase [Dyadobacter frigoris]